MTKDKIIERLLEDKSITAKEAVILLKEEKGFQQFTPNSLIEVSENIYSHVVGKNIDVYNPSTTTSTLDINS